MPIVRINADGPQAVPAHGRALPGLESVAQGAGPVIVMIHGYKYLPGHPVHCPHHKILSLKPNSSCIKMQSWPRRLGFEAGHSDEGLALAFGWNARGALWSAQARAIEAGQALAQVLRRLYRANPDRPVHILSHSMGTEVALEALHHVPAGAVQRIVSMTGACYRQRALAALDTVAGREVEFFNIVSRENDTFDFLYERLIAPPVPGDRSLGHGLEAPNAVTVQIDCPATLDLLDRLGHPIALPERRICHWSSYTRPGILRFYNALLREPERLPLHRLRHGVPQCADPRWSRLLPRPALTLPRGALTHAS